MSIGILPKRKKHPAHLARRIVALMDDRFIGWSIYPDQLPAMERALLKALHRAAQQRLLWGQAWRLSTIRSLLKSIGLVPPPASSLPPPATTRRRPRR